MATFYGWCQSISYSNLSTPWIFLTVNENLIHYLHANVLIHLYLFPHFDINNANMRTYYSANLLVALVMCLGAKSFHCFVCDARCWKTFLEKYTRALPQTQILSVTFFEGQCSKVHLFQGRLFWQISLLTTSTSLISNHDFLVISKLYDRKVQLDLMYHFLILGAKSGV